MKIEIAKWKYNAISPVMFMVDDLANIVMKKSKNNIGDDWGHLGTQKNSMWNFLNKYLYSNYPHIKTTFFLVVGKRAPMRRDESYTYVNSIEEQEFIEFLIYLNQNSNVEIAYHGITHGTPGEGINDFRQEWETFQSLDEAIETIEKGKEIYFKSTGFKFYGGKYCGYKKGVYGDESINKTDFLWWCRDWEGNYDSLKDNSKSLDIEYFDKVIDIPSTIDGSFLTLKNIKFSKKYLKSLYMFFRYGFTLEKQIEELLKNRQIISIQEHSSPYRTDNLMQYPNIVSDIDNLNYIFSYLDKKNIWYATGSEIANYFSIYNNCKIKIIDNYFIIEVNSTKEIKSTMLTLIVSENIEYIIVNNRRYFPYKKKDKYLIDIPFVQKSKYYVEKNV